MWSILCAAISFSRPKKLLFTSKVDLPCRASFCFILFVSGRVLAVLGPSGAGKSSLLNILAQQQKRNFSGTLCVNGVKPGNTFKSISAFVQQEDIFLGNMTVYETLLFHAMLKVPASQSLEQKRQRVADLIHELGLQACQHTKIGVPGIFKGISGGEKKRLSIAVELVTSPSILFLDEPYVASLYSHHIIVQPDWTPKLHSM